MSDNHWDFTDIDSARLEGQIKLDKQEIEGLKSRHVYLWVHIEAMLKELEKRYIAPSFSDAPDAAHESEAE